MRKRVGIFKQNNKKDGEDGGGGATVIIVIAEQTNKQTRLMIGSITFVDDFSEIVVVLPETERKKNRIFRYCALLPVAMPWRQTLFSFRFIICLLTAVFCNEC